MVKFLNEIVITPFSFFFFIINVYLTRSETTSCVLDGATEFYSIIFHGDRNEKLIAQKRKQNVLFIDFRIPSAFNEFRVKVIIVEEQYANYSRYLTIIY